jgi:ketosteroid isomerase-like protein
MEKKIEHMVESFLADFDAARFEAYSRFFVEGPKLVLIIPRVGVLRGLGAYLEYESRSTKLTGRSTSWEDRTIEVFDNLARVMGLMTMTFSAGQESREIRERITFLFERDDRDGWKCFHLQATLTD